LHAIASAEREVVADTFLGVLPAPRPYIVGLAGSVAVGKSTTSRVLQELLARWPAHPSVELVTTDGFLYPNSVLVERGLMERKGFPESYDTGALVKFLAALKAGEPEVSAPAYSHIRYDIIEHETQVLREPDIVIVEGLYASLPDDEAEQLARFVWRTINGVNLREEILPTRARAQLVLEKGPDHRVRQVRLRR
jgi:type I pantothenate kinase